MSILIIKPIILESLILTILTIVPILGSTAFFIVAERKIMGAIQRRKGPNVVGFLGLLQPVADGLKLITKELIIPEKANYFFFLASPMLILWLSLIGWAFIPFNFNNCYLDVNLSVLYILAISSLGIYGVILSGWSSNSRYAV
jgi:NADH:ubiquinone oxidoreductase subunit H